MTATPNKKVTLAGSGVLLHVLNPSGEPVPVLGSEDGEISTNEVASRVGRTVHLASQTLPAAGAFTAQPAYAVPEGVAEITAYVTYTRGDTGGQVVLRQQFGNGTEIAYETAVVSSNSNDGTVQNQLNVRELLSPIKDQAGPLTFHIVFSIPAGSTTFALLAAEIGVPAVPGTCAITLTASYGA